MPCSLFLASILSSDALTQLFRAFMRNRFRENSLDCYIRIDQVGSTLSFKEFFNEYVHYSGPKSVNLPASLVKNYNKEPDLYLQTIKDYLEEQIYLEDIREFVQTDVYKLHKLEQRLDTLRPTVRNVLNPTDMKDYIPLLEKHGFLHAYQVVAATKPELRDIGIKKLGHVIRIKRFCSQVCDADISD